MNIIFPIKNVASSKTSTLVSKSGNILASKTFDGSGSNDRFYGISTSDANELVMVGYTEDSNGDKNGWMVTTDPDGNL